MTARRTAYDPVDGTALASEDARALTELLGRPLESLERVGNGRNSRVYRACAGGSEYAAKFYFRPTADGRNRLQIEFSSLQFLWRHGLRSIAQPLLSDANRQVGLYQFIHGEPVDAAHVSTDDVARVISFVRDLKKLAAAENARELGSAAEAHFTIGGVVQNVADRLARLEAMDTKSPAHAALRRFLQEEFSPAFRTLSARAAAGAPAELAWQYRTLSPSDLGFHNALRARGRQLVFLDFEYFGWDDPAKTLSDALLHPMMRMESERRAELVHGFEEVFGADQNWHNRVERLYPLFALKWCMIMLNEFRPEQIERRRYVDGDAEEAHAIQMRQLEGARRLLDSIMRGNGSFPYWGRDA